MPQIQRTNLANTLLYLKVLGIDDVLAFPLLDPPPRNSVLEGLRLLHCLGALDVDGKVTELGHHMVSFTSSQLCI